MLVTSRALRRALIVLSALLLSACGQETRDNPIELEPVAGKVTLGGSAVRSGNVLLIPDSARGNASAIRPSGTIDAEGNYQLATRYHPGAPPGWYKVVFFPNPDSAPVPKKYTDENTTDLRIEVIADAPPGKYDLRLLY